MRSVPDELRARYLLSDWDITIEHRDEHDENLGDSDIRVESREAIIRLHMTEIIENLRKWPKETEQRILEHEVCEIAVTEDCRGLPEHIIEHPEFMEFRDRVAERLRLCVTRAL